MIAKSPFESQRPPGPLFPPNGVVSKNPASPPGLNVNGGRSSITNVLIAEAGTTPAVRPAVCAPLIVRNASSKSPVDVVAAAIAAPVSPVPVTERDVGGFEPLNVNCEIGAGPPP